jgi:amino acid transporter
MNDVSARPSGTNPTYTLRRELGRWDLALLFVVAVLNLNTVASIATSGPVTLWLWLAALLCFFLPQGVAVVELSHRYPGEGGLYLWSKKLFGDFHGFIAGWAYLTTNVFYIPFVLLYLLGVGSYLGGPRVRMLIDRPLVAFPAVLCALLLITVANVVGVGVGKWVNNLGGMGTLLAAGTLIGLSASTFGMRGRNLHASDLVHLHLDWTIVSALGAMCFSLIGLELASIMGDEIRNPERTLPGAVALSGIACGLLCSHDRRSAHGHARWPNRSSRGICGGGLADEPASRPTLDAACVGYCPQHLCNWHCVGLAYRRRASPFCIWP